MAAYCGHCGAATSDAARFCRTCGTAVPEVPVAKRAVQSPPPPPAIDPPSPSKTTAVLDHQPPPQPLPSAANPTQRRKKHVENSQLQLTATISLSRAETLAIVRQVAETLRPKTLSTGQRVIVDRAGEHRVSLSIMNLKIVQFCTFDADVSEAVDGVALTVGPLATFKTSQPVAVGFIPVGSKSVVGFALYKQFLEAVAAAIRFADPRAEVSVGSW